MRITLFINSIAVRVVYKIAYLSLASLIMNML